MTKDQLQEIKDFWNREIDEYDCIVTVKEIAQEDIHNLISEINEYDKLCKML